MARVRISNRLQNDFAQVPNGVWRSDLSFTAKGVACYLYSLRDGSVPYVAEMERALGLGRDARRKAFAALEAFGAISWEIETDARNAIVAKTLVIDPAPFLRVTENQADGCAAPERSHAPEKPAGGSAVPVATESRRSRDAKSGDTLRQEKQERARRARACGALNKAEKGSASSGASQNGNATPQRKRRRSASSVGSAVSGVVSKTRPRASAEKIEAASGVSEKIDRLSTFQRSLLREGKPVLIDGALCDPASTEAGAMRSALRSMEGGAA